jgi:hypothetical protein
MRVAQSRHQHPAAKIDLARLAGRSADLSDLRDPPVGNDQVACVLKRTGLDIQDRRVSYDYFCHAGPVPRYAFTHGRHEPDNGIFFRPTAGLLDSMLDGGMA